MEITRNFKRYEKKYILSLDDYEKLLACLSERIEPDEHPAGTVLSLYYDTEDYRLIRRSLEQPVYKEKLRLRSYGVPASTDPVFVELKKKYKGVVYKRRVSMEAGRAMAWLAGEAEAGQEGQLIREVEWFLQKNRPEPRALIACDRRSWRGREDPQLRITFDEQIRWRETELDLCAGDGGEALLPPGQVLMEIKLPQTAPLWLAHLLSERKLYPVRYSKYGKAYQNNILPEFINGVILHA